ncbi:hypothetical protein HH308_17505 [Gordonia sp. TBRC 11910]|uniref:Polyketide cyclase / dehydrase and lipid transport n=1 Tax=Gordonia asplenii TaxID=2725283 RepID=A0A848KXP6_9ACTN|nr:hypothetical protein [Gordonia asplenii]NMO03012.1 hypothetical protein [Gordonia asplenii]
MDDHDLPPLQEEPEETPYRPSTQQWLAVGVIAAGGAGFVLYLYFKDHGLGQSAALYIGIPLVIAVVITLSAPPKSAAGTAIKVTTLLLLLAVPLLGEGACCVLMAAPIFYLVVYVGARCADSWRAKRSGRPPGALAVVVPLLLVTLALEGTTPVLTPPGAAASTASRVIDLPASQVAAALARPLRFDVPRGGILAIGFPTPRDDSGGLDVGAVRRITFDGAHHRSGPVVQHHWGTAASTLTLRVVARTPSSATFTAESDTTPIATWLRWNRIDVSWTAVDARRTELRWTVHYTRLLSPSWYFGPIERFVTWRAADYLIRTVDVDGERAGRHATVD